MKTFLSLLRLFPTFLWAVGSDLYVAPAFQMDFSLDFTQDLYSCWLQYLAFPFNLKRVKRELANSLEKKTKSPWFICTAISALMLLVVWAVPSIPYGHRSHFHILDSFECSKDQQRQTRPVWSRNDQTECQNVLKRGKILSQNDPIGSQKGPVGFHNCQIAKMARGWW